MINIDFDQFFNPFDIIFIITILISFFFGIKNGLMKSFLNLSKWIIIFYLIRNCFDFLRPIFDIYITNQTLSDILIFFFTLIISYILISFINRIVIGAFQPKNSFLIDISFGGMLGILRGYVIFVLFIFFLNVNFYTSTIPKFLKNGTFEEIVNYGVSLLEQMPRSVNET